MPYNCRAPDSGNVMSGRMRNSKLRPAVAVVALFVISTQAQAEYENITTNDAKFERCLNSPVVRGGSVSAANDCYLVEIQRQMLTLASLYRKDPRSSPDRRKRWQERLENDCWQQARRETGGSANDMRLFASDCVLQGLNRRIAVLSR